MFKSLKNNNITRGKNKVKFLDDKVDAKILLFDIETAPNLSYTWGKWQQDVIDFKDHWYMLCYAAKWLDDGKMITSKLTDYNSFKKDKTDDFNVVKSLWTLLDKADIVITHNGDEFDIKKANARFVYHGLPPPSPYKTIDTKKVAKKYFSFTSNSLNDLGRYLKLGEKVKHEGFDLWLNCMTGEKKAWETMIKYNKQDVILLEKIYKRFLSWITNHPNLGLYKKLDFACPNCGSQHLNHRGFNYTKTNTYRRVQCVDCHAWSQYTTSEKRLKNKIKN